MANCNFAINTISSVLGGQRISRRIGVGEVIKFTHPSVARNCFEGEGEQGVGSARRHIGQHLPSEAEAYPGHVGPDMVELGSESILARYPGRAVAGGQEAAEPRIPIPIDEDLPVLEAERREVGTTCIFGQDGIAAAGFGDDFADGEAVAVNDNNATPGRAALSLKDPDQNAVGAALVPGRNWVAPGARFLPARLRRVALPHPPASFLLLIRSNPSRRGVRGLAAHPMGRTNEARRSSPASAPSPPRQRSR